jgi:hypothetical protein
MTVRTQMMGDDLLVCVLGGVYTDVEDDDRVAPPEGNWGR